MTQQITLTIPDDISEWAKEIAQITSQPIEQVLIAHLQTLNRHGLPLDVQSDLDALPYLSDDALWTIAHEQLPAETQQRAHFLMTKNTSGLLNEVEQSELDELVNRADRLILRKADVSVILKSRGYSFQQQDFKPTHE